MPPGVPLSGGTARAPVSRAQGAGFQVASVPASTIPHSHPKFRSPPSPRLLTCPLSLLETIQGHLAFKSPLLFMHNICAGQARLNEKVREKEQVCAITAWNSSRCSEGSARLGHAYRGHVKSCLLILHL